MAIELPHSELPTNKSNNQTWLAGIPCIAPYKKVDHFRVAHIMEISSHILSEFPSPLLRKSQWLQVESAVLLAKSETHAVFLEAVVSVAITCAISDA